MCGFVLILSADGRAPDNTFVDRMAEVIAHRGPDDAAAFSESAVAIAFRRLSILDVAESSRQPMISADGRYAIVFNGAIYNFVELRAELEGYGWQFRTTGDTEVLLTAYQHWGVGCLSRLNGMWSFVAYDRHERRIFAARDRFGVKPLFWYYDARGLVLASEIKAIRDSGYARLAPNRRTMAAYVLDGRLDDADETFYAGIRRVPAGSFFEGDARAAPTFRRFWGLCTAIDGEPPTEPVEEFRAVFDDAVRIRMRADVPLGVFLSGGLDSTSIISSMTTQRSGPHRIAALGYFDPEFDETPFISETLDQTDAALTRMEPDYRRQLDVLERHLWHQDEPVHSFTSLVIYELMRLARELGLKVMLSGQGADEVLAGYPSYFLGHWCDLAQRGHMWTAHREIEAFARGHGKSTRQLHAQVASRMLGRLKPFIPGYRKLARLRQRQRIRGNPWVSEELKNEWQPADEPYAQTLTDLLRTSIENAHLPLYLRVDDRNSMAHAIEVRMPFLDHRLVSLAFRLTPNFKLRGEQTKVVLREAMKGRIPESVRARVRKFGFPTSTNTWFQNALRTRCRDLLASRKTREAGIWNLAEIERMLDDNDRSISDDMDRLFKFAQVGIWLGMGRA